MLSASLIAYLLGDLDDQFPNQRFREGGTVLTTLERNGCDHLVETVRFVASVNDSIQGRLDELPLYRPHNIVEVVPLYFGHVLYVRLGGGGVKV